MRLTYSWTNSRICQTVQTIMNITSGNANISTHWNIFRHIIFLVQAMHYKVQQNICCSFGSFSICISSQRKMNCIQNLIMTNPNHIIAQSGHFQSPFPWGQEVNNFISGLNNNSPSWGREGRFRFMIVLAGLCFRVGLVHVRMIP